MATRTLKYLAIISSLYLLFIIPSFGQVVEQKPGWRGKRIKNWMELKYELEVIQRKNKEIERKQKDPLYNNKPALESLDGYIIDGNDVIKVISISNVDIRISKSIIEHGLDFSKIPINSENIKEVKTEIYIQNSEIEINNKIEPYRSLFADGITFSKEINFNGTNLAGQTMISNSVFKKDAIFSEFNRDEPLSQKTYFQFSLVLLETKFEGNANFGGSSLGAMGSIFTKVDFEGTANFERAGFYRTSFSNITFKNNAIFKGASFHIATISESIFYANTNFSESKNYNNDLYNNGLTLSNNTYIGNVDFRNSYFKVLNISNSSITNVIDGLFDFRNATLIRSNFAELQFSKKVDFTDVKFGELTSVDQPNLFFNYVTFQSDVNFTRAIFKGYIAFENVNFEKKAIFTNAEFKTDTNSVEPMISLSYVTFQDLILDINQFPKYGYWVSKKIPNTVRGITSDATGRAPQKLSQVFEQFVTLYSKQDNLNAKNKALFYMKTSELEEATRNKTFIEKLKTSEFQYYLLWGWSSGWGTKILWVIGWYIRGLLFFAFIYYLLIDKVKVWKSTESIPMPDTEFGTKIFTFPWNFTSSKEKENSEKKENEEIKDLISAIKLSKILVFKFGRRDSYVEGSALKFAVWIEWIFGVYLLIVFVITLTNTVPVINTLISHIF